MADKIYGPASFDRDGKTAQKEKHSKFSYMACALAVVVGMLIGQFISLSNKEHIFAFYNKAQQIKAQCEAELPRDKFCKIVIKAEIEE